jgi:hypothetical protein
MTTQPDPLPVLTGLNQALERLTAALVAGRPDAVLAAEESLGTAVRQLAALRPTADADPAQLVDSIRAIRVAVFLCQRLGRASAALIQATASAGPYAANGQFTPATVPATVISRT